MQTIGNLCLTLAGIIYLLPLQHLLLEVARKRDDGGAAIAGILVLGPMWLLLLVGMILATAQGGFDVLPLRRGLQHALIIAVTLALAVATFVSFTAHFRTGWGTRLTLGLPIYLVPLITLALVALVLNPGLAARFPVGAVRIPWLVLGCLSLAGCVLYVGFAAARRTAGAAAQIAHTAGNNSKVEADVLARIPTLDPELEFFSLLSNAAHGSSPEIRASATERLRTHPGLMPRLIEELGKSDPTTAITFAATTELAAEERRELARPLHAAMENYGAHIHDRLRFYPKDWLRQQRAWGRETYPKINSKFAGTGVDFASLPGAFDQAFIRESN
jgi:hypothetical protein